MRGHRQELESLEWKLREEQAARSLEAEISPTLTLTITITITLTQEEQAARRLEAEHAATEQRALQAEAEEAPP